MLQIDLLPQPMGEGLSYEVSFQDLRPSLDWSPEAGWRVLTTMVAFSLPSEIIHLYIHSVHISPLRKHFQLAGNCF